MSDLTKRTSPPVGVEPLSAQRCLIFSGEAGTSNGLRAGVSLTRGYACYIDSSGLVQKAVSTVWFMTGSGGQVAFDGIAGENYISGAYGVTLYGIGAKFGYAASGLTP